MLKAFAADLHIHTCLSPCADLEMTPLKIVQMALSRELDMIAITDHNSAENVAAAKKAAEGTGLIILAGMEITSLEEVHLLALFEDLDLALQLQRVIYLHLPLQENDDRLYGHQIVVNELNEITGFNKRLLIGATSLPVYTIFKLIKSFNGICIASHIDRNSFSVLSQLAFIPAELAFDALEISPNLRREEAVALYEGLNRFPWVSFSDAHYLKDVGRRRTIFTLGNPSFHGLQQTFQETSGVNLDWY
ncbi:MAG: PHP domain-containing protein [Dissulfurispiraceae bacterium]